MGEGVQMKERTLHRLVELVRRTGRQEELWSRGDRIVVAVSGERIRRFFYI